MKDNVIWVDFSAKRRKNGLGKRFFSSIISFFKAPKNTQLSQASKRDLAKAHKSM